MGIKMKNLEGEYTAAVAGDATQKTIAHNMNTIPSFVFFQANAAGVDPSLVSKSRTNIVVLGQAGTFDVLILR